MLSTLVVWALDWAMIALSFFNLIALLWLGLTVVLNAERRTPETWIAGVGLVLCAIFFIGHTAVVGRAIGGFDLELGFWWRVSWLLTIAAPYLWYVGVLSYTGVLRIRNHRLGLGLTTGLGLLALTLFVIKPLPSYTDVAERAPVLFTTVGGIPVAAFGYPLYSMLCFALALAALTHPQASLRFMGDQARTRARPWLISATAALITVSLTFGILMAWFLSQVQARPAALFFLRRLPLFMAFDVFVQTLIAAALVLTGQAIVTYEIFTSKTLPRGGLRQAWHRNLVLAAGFGIVLGLSLSVPLHNIYRILLATVLMTVFYALLNWRSYAERERSMDRLRPFVASQRLYEQLLQPSMQSDLDLHTPFHALCADVLATRSAYLVALGPLAPLVGPPLIYTPRPNQQAAPLNAAALSTLIDQMRSPQVICVPVDPHAYNGAVWAVPLWSERGLIGALLLGPKRDNAVYTQEEIELARATGERLIDTQASAALARRLMHLQRQHLAESQVIDGRVRRVLHDDILPQLHTAMLMLGVGGQAASGNGLRTNGSGPESTTQSEVVTLLADVHRQIANLLYAMPQTGTPDVARLGLIGALRQAVAGELASAFDEVTWQIAPHVEHATRAIPTLTAEVVVYAAREAIRNAARYGRNGDSTRSLRLQLTVAWKDGLEITVEDDGIGFGSALNTDGGSGQGLALHGTLMAVVGGTLAAEALPNTGTRVALALPRSAYEHSIVTA